MLIALISLCFKSSRNKRTGKGQTAGMSNVSKSVNDDVREEEQSEEENMQIESCIVFSQFEDHNINHTSFVRLAPPSGLRGSCVEAVFH